MSYMQEANAIAAGLRAQQRSGVRFASRGGPKKNASPSPVSLDVLAYLRRFFEENDQLPPISKIRDAFGWSSLQAADHHLRVLAQFGLIEKNAVGKWRFVRTGRAAVDREHCNA